MIACCSLIAAVRSGIISEYFKPKTPSFSLIASGKTFCTSCAIKNGCFVFSSSAIKLPITVLKEDTFVIASVMGTIGAGTIIGVELWKSASMAAILGVAVVLEALARAYIVDGKLDDAEINESFGKANGNK